MIVTQQESLQIDKRMAKQAMRSLSEFCLRKVLKPTMMYLFNSEHGNMVMRAKVLRTLPGVCR